MNKVLRHILINKSFKNTLLHFVSFLVARETKTGLKLGEGGSYW